MGCLLWVLSLIYIIHFSLWGYVNCYVTIGHVIRRFDCVTLFNNFMFDTMSFPSFNSLKFCDINWEVIHFAWCCLKSAEIISNLLIAKKIWRMADSVITGIILGMGSANKRRRYYVMPSLIGWAHIENDPCISIVHVDGLLLQVLGHLQSQCWPSLDHGYIQGTDSI